MLDPDGLPITLLREGDGTPAQVRLSVPGEADLVARVFVAPGRPGAAAAARHRHRGQPPAAARGDRPAVRRHHRAPAAPGAAPRRRRRPRGAGVHAADRPPRARGVPHQRGPRRLPRPRADPRAHRRRGRARRSTSTPPSRSPAPARCSPRTPRCPRASTGSRASWSSSTSARAARCPAYPIERILTLGAEDYSGGDSGVFNMAVMGFRLSQRANGVSLLHGHVSRGMFNGLWPAFDEAEVPITSITNGVHAPTWVAREVFELANKAGADTDSDTADVWNVVDQIPSADLWSTKRDLRAAAGRGRPRPTAQVVPQARRRPGRARLDRHRARPRRAHDRLRAARCVVQAADADAQRPRAAQEAAAAPRAPDPAGDRRQGAPGRRRRQEADPGDRAARRRPGGAPPRSPTCPTTTSRWRSRSTRAATCG